MRSSKGLATSQLLGSSPAKRCPNLRGATIGKPVCSTLSRTCGAIFHHILRWVERGEKHQYRSVAQFCYKHDAGRLNPDPVCAHAPYLSFHTSGFCIAGGRSSYSSTARLISSRTFFSRNLHTSSCAQVITFKSCNLQQRSQIDPYIDAVQPRCHWKEECRVQESTETPQRA
jgi:hypothetical protein